MSECLTEDGRSYQVPRELLRLMIKCNETQGHLRDWLDYWEQADELMHPAPDIGEAALHSASTDRARQTRELATRSAAGKRH